MGQCTVWEIVISALCWRQMATEEGMEGRTGAQQEQMGQAQVERWLLRWLLGRSMNRRKLILQKVEWPGTTIAKIFAYRSPNSSYMARTWGKKQINTAVWEELDFTNSICEPWYNDTGQTTLRASPLATPFWPRIHFFFLRDTYWHLVVQFEMCVVFRKMSYVRFPRWWQWRQR